MFQVVCRNCNAAADQPIRRRVPGRGLSQTLPNRRVMGEVELNVSRPIATGDMMHFANIGPRKFVCPRLAQHRVNVQPETIGSKPSRGMSRFRLRI